MVPPMMIEALMWELRFVRPLPWVMLEDDGEYSWWKTSGGDLLYMQRFGGVHCIPHIIVSVLSPTAPERSPSHTTILGNFPDKKTALLESLAQACDPTLQDRLDRWIRRAQQLLIENGQSQDWCFEDGALRSMLDPALELALPPDLLEEVQGLQTTAAHYLPTNEDWLPTFVMLEGVVISVPQTSHARMDLLQALHLLHA